MKKIILGIIAFSASLINAQEVTISTPQQLLKGVETEAYNPVLNESGDFLLYSGANYKGLKMYDFKDQVSKEITKADFAGYKPAFASADEVIYSTKEGRKLNSSVKYNLASSEGVEIAQPKLAVATVGSKVIVTKNGESKEYSPIESTAGYIWPSLSPDGTKVMFFAAGKGVVIMSLDGNVLSMPGNYFNPVWYGNDYIVAQNSTDDGHQYSSSQILLLNLDGTFKKELTKPLSMTMNPTVSFSSNKIVYNTIDGKLFMINITIK